MRQITSNTWFDEVKFDHSSQNGEDGIISCIFDIIGTKNRFVVECGAVSGVMNSNARKLITEEGWSSLLIEADITAFERLRENYKRNAKVTCLNRFVSFEGRTSFDAIFVEQDVPVDFDLFVLDIDGNEYHVWDAMTKYRPRVVMVEFNQTIPNEIDFVQPRDMSVQQGSSLRAFVRLGETKKYRRVALTAINAFFVRDDQADPFRQLDNSLDVLRPYNQYETKIFQLYDGTLKLAGLQTLIWHKLPIIESAVQVLPKHKRKFEYRVASHASVRKIKHLVRRSPIYPILKKVRKLLKK